MEKFEGLNVSSKFGICGLPLRVDSYKTCSFGCRYCFANGRKIMEFDKTLQVANINSIENRLDRIFNKNDYKDTSFLDKLIANRITWHFGGMSDPFQPCEEKYGITRKIIDIGNYYDITMLISTKSDTVYNANINPKLHALQLSITNVGNRKDIEPNVPSIDNRLRFFRDLKKDGFRVGIRIQPFIPNISGLDIVKMFEGADHFIIEGLKVIPQEGEQKDFCFKELGVNPKLFTQIGLLNMIPQYRLQLYKPLLDYFDKHNISYSVSDNDLRRYGNNRCCCGDKLIAKSSGFDVTALIHDCKHWTLQTVLDKSNEYAECVAKDLFTSNRTEGCKTVHDFYKMRFKRKSSPMSPNFQYTPQQSFF